MIVSFSKTIIYNLHTHTYIYINQAWISLTKLFNKEKRKGYLYFTVTFTLHMLMLVQHVTFSKRIFFFHDWAYKIWIDHSHTTITNQSLISLQVLKLNYKTKFPSNAKNNINNNLLYLLQRYDDPAEKSNLWDCSLHKRNMSKNFIKENILQSKIWRNNETNIKERVNTIIDP